MAIFGSLHQMSLADLLPLMSAKKGALELFNLEQRRSITLFFDSGALSCIYEGTRELSPQHARAAIAWLLGARRGSFEFVPEALPRGCRNPLAWPVAQLLLSTVTIRDEIEHYRVQLPHADTKFTLTSSGAVPGEADKEFADAAHELLAQAASARQLSKVLGLPLDQVRYRLLRLRQAGVVSVAKQQNEGSARSANVARRLLGALRQRFLGRSTRQWKP